MGRSIKHILWLALALALLTALAAPGVAAAQQPITPIDPVSQIVINDPVTSSVEIITQEDPVLPVANTIPDIYHTTIADAAAELRQKMVNREMSIVVGLRWHNADRDLMSTVLHEAFAHTGNPKEGDYLYRNYGGCMMGLGGHIDGATYYITLTYNIAEYYTTLQQENEVDAAVAALLEQLNVWDKSDYEKVKAVYDYICSHVTYDYEGLYGNDSTTYSAWKALIKGTSVCQGYASLFYRLALELGVDSRFISGTGNGGAHGWNIVKLNGLYYNLDATWDSQRVEMNWEYDYFLRCPSTFKDHIRDASYETAEFHAQYPMGEKDFNQSEIFTFEIKDNAVIITGYTGNDTQVAVPSELAGYPVKELGKRAFFQQHDITSVTLPNGITAIGEDAFCGCGQLVTINFPASLQSIGPYAFTNCRKLTSIHLPSGVTTIGMNAFECCDALVEVSLPEGLTYIGFGTFRDCFQLTELTLPSTLTFLGGSVFEGCTALRQVNIPAGITAIKLSAFLECVNLLSIDLPASVKTIENNAFKSCDKLKTLDLSNVTYIGDSAFEGCVSLTGVTLNAGLTYLGEHAFFGCKCITEAHVPAGITELKMGVFGSCASLASLTLPDTMTSIGHAALSSCTSLTSLTLPGKLNFIDATAFQGAGFTSIEIPVGVTAIPMFAFMECADLKTVTLPASITLVDMNAFTNCSSLSTVYFNGDRSRWDAIDIAYGNDPLTNATLICITGEKLPGDINGDYTVTDDDAMYLLRYTLFPNRYPISLDPDINSDGLVNDSDAMYLLRYTLFPSRYPLYPAA